MLNFDDFLITKPILDLKMSLDRARQDLKFCTTARMSEGSPGRPVTQGM